MLAKPRGSDHQKAFAGDDMTLSDFIRENKELNKAKKIAFFGGSFHPWHPGHKACVKLMPKDVPLIIAPDHNPYKEFVGDKENPTQTILNDIRDLEGPRFVYDGFLSANEKNPTTKWVLDLKKEFPDKAISLLIGFDSFMSIDRWIDGKGLLHSLDALYVASRLEGSVEKKEQTQRIKEIAPNLNLYFLGHHPFEDVSSTEIRRGLK